MPEPVVTPRAKTARHREPAARAARAIFLCELRRMLRDRRALLAAVVLPMLLYPLIFLGTDRLQQLSRDSLADRHVTIVHDLRALPPALAARILEPLRARAEDGTLRVEAVQVLDRLGDPDTAPEFVRTLLGTERQLLLVGRAAGAKRAASSGAAEADASEIERADLPEVALWFDGSNELAGEALRRARGALDDLAAEIRAEQLDALLGGDPGAAFAATPVDVASAEDTGGLALGRLLPLLAILAILSGASMAALDVFSGEREAGTLETLLVQPVPAAQLARGKFLVVAATGTVSLLGNAGSLIACAALGLGSLPGVAAAAQEGGMVLGGARLAGGALLFLPTVVLLSALLSIAAARAKSFREGQHAVLPITLLALVPAALPMAPSVELDLLIAAVPIAGPALALRDALSGQLRLLPALVMLSSHLAWAWLSMRWLARELTPDRLLTGRVTEEELALKRVQSRRALAWGWASVGAVYLLGGWLQSLALVPGLLATLWLVVPALALGAGLGTSRRAGVPLRVTLGLTRPNPLHLAGAALLVPALALGVQALFAWQTRYLRLPAGAGELPGLDQLGVPTLLFLFAVSPGICEELLFRGALLSGLRHDLPPWRCVLWQAVLFGAVHASIYRLLPTAALGAVLAALTLRGRSVLPAMLLHMLYNAAQAQWPEQLAELPGWSVALAAVLGAALFLTPAPPRRSAPA